MERKKYGIKEQVELMVATQVLMVATMVAALNEKQRRAIRERDEYRCQFPRRHDCNAREGLEIHHILPQGYAKRFDIDPDYPENVITICKNAHRRIIHPDTQDAQRRYKEDQNAFKKLHDDRAKKLENRQTYWNDAHDRPMQAVAVRNTQKARRLGWQWPWKREGDKK